MLFDHMAKCVECAGYDIRIGAVGLDGRKERRNGAHAEVGNSVDGSSTGPDRADKGVKARRITEGNNELHELQLELRVKLVTEDVAIARSTCAGSLDRIFPSECFGHRGSQCRHHGIRADASNLINKPGSLRIVRCRDKSLGNELLVQLHALANRGGVYLCTHAARYQGKDHGRETESRKQ